MAMRHSDAMARYPRIAAAGFFAVLTNGNRSITFRARKDPLELSGPFPMRCVQHLSCGDVTG
jgi:hypothetical protein